MELLMVYHLSNELEFIFSKKKIFLLLHGLVKDLEIPKYSSLNIVYIIHV